MPYIEVIWDLPDDPDGNVHHIAEHGLTRLDVEHVLNQPQRRTTSRSSGLPMVFGQTPNGEAIAVVFEKISDLHVYPITAYEIDR